MDGARVVDVYVAAVRMPAKLPGLRKNGRLDQFVSLALVGSSCTFSECFDDFSMLVPCSDRVLTYEFFATSY